MDVVVYSWTGARRLVRICSDTGQATRDGVAVAGSFVVLLLWLWLLLWLVVVVVWYVMLVW